MASETLRENSTIHDGDILPPEGCPRGRTDCAPLARVAPNDYRTFICCGQNDGSHPGPEQDRWRLCIKSQEGVDILLNVDERDMVDIANVLTSGLSWISVDWVEEHEERTGATPTPTGEEADDGEA